MQNAKYRVRTPVNHPPVFVRLGSGEKVRLISGSDKTLELWIGDCEKIYSAVKGSRITPIVEKKERPVVKVIPVIESPVISVEVGVMEVTVEAGSDGEFGTSDDVVEVKPKKSRKQKKAEKKEDAVDA